MNIDAGQAFNISCLSGATLDLVHGLSTKRPSAERDAARARRVNHPGPHLVKLLEDGVLPFHRTGKHRRVRLADLMQYEDARDRASEEAMAEHARQAQESSIE